MNLDKDIEALVNRINNYLGNGGLFNPELMEHDKVSELIIDCREAFAAALLKEAHVENEPVAWYHEDYPTSVYTSLDSFAYDFATTDKARPLYASPPAQEAHGTVLTVGYDLSPALVEGKTKNKLIELGWCPPQEVEALKAKLEKVGNALELARTGIQWYVENSNDASGCDDEALEEIDNALAAIDNTNEL